MGCGESRVSGHRPSGAGRGEAFRQGCARASVGQRTGTTSWCPAAVVALGLTAEAGGLWGVLAGHGDQAALSGQRGKAGQRKASWTKGPAPGRQSVCSGTVVEWRTHPR